MSESSIDMTKQIWTPDFLKISVAYLCLFVSCYMLLPVVPVEMAGRLGLSASQVGTASLLFVPGMLLVGPFMSHMLDAYRRKSVAMFAFVVMSLVTVAYGIVDSKEQFMALCLVHGIAFQMASTAGLTLGIDVTNPQLRTEGNVKFVSLARLGMFVGVALGILVWELLEFKAVLYASVLAGLVGILILSALYVPFRAPMSVSPCSCDRFMLFRGLIPALNVSLFTMLVGLLLPMHQTLFHDGIRLWGVSIPVFAFIASGFLISCLILLRVGITRVLELVAVGSALLLCGFICINEVPPLFYVLLIGLGFGLVLPVMLLLLIRLAEHCQRCTANATYQFAVELGVLSGIMVACCLDNAVIYQAGIGIAALALFLFGAVTYPYYKKMRRR